MSCETALLYTYILHEEIKLGSMSDGQPPKEAQETATEDDSIAVLSSLGEGWGFYQIRLLIIL